MKVALHELTAALIPGSETYCFVFVGDHFPMQKQTIKGNVLLISVKAILDNWIVRRGLL